MDKNKNIMMVVWIRAEELNEIDNNSKQRIYDTTNTKLSG